VLLSGAGPGATERGGVCGEGPGPGGPRGLPQPAADTAAATAGDTAEAADDRAAGATHGGSTAAP